MFDISRQYAMIESKRTGGLQVMSIIKHSNISFLLSNIFSRMLIPFSSILYTSLRYMVLAPSEHVRLFHIWTTSFFSMVFFIFMQSTVLKRSRTRYRQKDLWALGVTWVLMAIFFQALVHATTEWVTLEIFLQSYDFLSLEPWPYMLLIILCTPRISST